MYSGDNVEVNGTKLQPPRNDAVYNEAETWLSPLAQMFAIGLEKTDLTNLQMEDSSNLSGD